MKRCGLLIKLTMLFCAAVTVVLATPSSLAYMAARSNTLHNSFRVESLPVEDITVPIRVRKTMINLSDSEVGPGGFEFHLVDAVTGEVTAAVSSETGWAEMQLRFTDEDVGKTYNYRLYEINDGRRFVSYDERVYEIGITLELNDAQEMTAALTMDGAAVTEVVAGYENRYYEHNPMPETGDDSQPMLWMAALIASGTGLVMLRKKKGIL